MAASKSSGRPASTLFERTKLILDSIDAGAGYTVRARADLMAEIEQLKQAMASRSVIEQAKGVIMSSTGCDADRAFELLKQQSQQTNRKLRDIALEIVAVASREHNGSASS